MEVKNKATKIQLFSLGTRRMRAFHMSWFAFFLCFFAWFGIAPLMAQMAGFNLVVLAGTVCYAFIWLLPRYRGARA